MSAVREKSTGELAREILRGTRAATLATHLTGQEGNSEGIPYASKVLLASGQDAAPLLLLSDLAQHGRNLGASPQAALLLDPGGGEDLDQPRLSLLGEIRACSDQTASDLAKSRYRRLHPGSNLYGDFGDFRLYRMEIKKAHLVAGFGRVRWFKASELLVPAALAASFAESEKALLRKYGSRLSAKATSTGTAWEPAGLDCDGFDLLSKGGKKDGDSTPSHNRVNFRKRLGSIGELEDSLLQLGASRN